MPQTMRVPDISTLLKGPLDRLDRVRQDAGIVFQALGLWGVVFFGANVILGVLPLGVTVSLGKLVDAMIGARGIGAMTSEVTESMWRFLIIMIISFFAYLFVVRFKERAAAIGGVLRDAVIALSLLIFLLLHQQPGLAFFLTLVLLIDVLAFETFQLRLGVLGLTILVSILVAEKAVRFTVLRSFTVGEGIAILVAMAMMLVLLKIRFARPAYAMHH